MKKSLQIWIKRSRLTNLAKQEGKLAFYTFQLSLKFLSIKRTIRSQILAQPYKKFQVTIGRQFNEVERTNMFSKFYKIGPSLSKVI